MQTRSKCNYQKANRSRKLVWTSKSVPLNPPTQTGFCLLLTVCPNKSNAYATDFALRALQTPWTQHQVIELINLFGFVANKPWKWIELNWSARMILSKYIGFYGISNFYSYEIKWMILTSVDFMYCRLWTQIKREWNFIWIIILCC